MLRSRKKDPAVNCDEKNVARNSSDKMSYIDLADQTTTPEANEGGRKRGTIVLRRELN